MPTQILHAITFRTQLIEYPIRTSIPIYSQKILPHSIILQQEHPNIMRKVLFTLLFCLSCWSLSAQEMPVYIGQDGISIAIPAFRTTQIRLLDLEGNEEHTFSIPYQVEHIAYGNGVVYVTITQNHRTEVVQFSLTGEQIGTFEVEAKPSAIHLSRGNIFVTITQNHRILKFSSRGELLGSIPLD